MNKTKVLLVEDDELVRHALHVAMEASDLDVEHVESVVLMLNPASLEGIDVVVTDILMPNCDGIELLAKLKQVRPGLPVIAISGGGLKGGQDFLQFAQSIGADATFEKPLNEEHLINRIKKLAARAAPRSA